LKSFQNVFIEFFIPETIATQQICTWCKSKFNWLYFSVFNQWH